MKPVPSFFLGTSVHVDAAPRRWVRCLMPVDSGILSWSPKRWLCGIVGHRYAQILGDDHPDAGTREYLVIVCRRCQNPVVLLELE